MLDARNFWLTRLALQRGLGLAYLIAFLVALQQFRPLLGEKGLLPVPDFVRQVPFRASPSLFYFYPKDIAFQAAAWLGILLSLSTVTGLSENLGNTCSIAVWTGLWVLYISFVNVGQVFYGFGWESILLEAGFYAIFLGSRKTAPPTLLIWIFRWLLFRIMFGAGLIKLRGDPCWRNLSCLDYHYETQPMPNPLSWYFHWGPEWTKQAGVLINHFTELVVPLGYFAPSPVSTAAGLLTILFQTLIMASGNLSWLNFLTIILAIPALDDRLLTILWRGMSSPDTSSSKILHGAVMALALLVAILSINPILNMLSPEQVMNTNYNPLHLVGTYGAFGGITRVRDEIIIEGTTDSVVTSKTLWRAYEFKGKPGDPARSPPQIAPYHLRIDWMMWFAAMSGYEQHPWFVHLIAKLLLGDRDTLSLLKSDPFGGQPPHYIRAELYEYHFTTPKEHRETGRWWTREWVGHYFPTVSLDNPSFQQALD